MTLEELVKLVNKRVKEIDSTLDANKMEIAYLDIGWPQESELSIGRTVKNELIVEN